MFSSFFSDDFGDLGVSSFRAKRYYGSHLDGLDLMGRGGGRMKKLKKPVDRSKSAAEGAWWRTNRSQVYADMVALRPAIYQVGRGRNEGVTIRVGGLKELWHRQQDKVRPSFALLSCSCCCCRCRRMH